MVLHGGDARDVAKESQSSICYHDESGRQLVMSRTLEFDSFCRAHADPIYCT